jgi:hypothetical protein
MSFLVSVVNTVCNRVCDFLFAPFRSLHPLVPLAVFSFLTGVAILVVYRFTSDQAAIRRAKDRMQAHVLAVRLFQDQLGVVLRSYGRILSATLGYLRLSLIPVLVMLGPLALLLVQLDPRFAYRPPRVGEPLLLHIRVARPEMVKDVALGLPVGVALAAPLLRDALEMEVVAQLEPREPGVWAVDVFLADGEYAKQLVISDKASSPLEKISLARVGPAFFGRILHPVEEPLPADAPVVSLALNYPERQLMLGRFELNWIAVFFVFSLVAGLVMKRPLRAEF